MKQHTKATRTTGGTQISVDEMEEMAFQEHGLMEVDEAAQVYRYTDNGGVHYVAPMRDAKAAQDAAWSTYQVDSTPYTLPDGRTVIGKDAYEAEVVKAVFGA